MHLINFFMLDKNRLQTLDFKVFWEIFNLMLQHRHKLFDDEYFKCDKPYIQRVYEIITEHLPYFWVFYDKITAETLGFCYFYDITPHKNLIHTVSATICFKKSARGKTALTGAKSLISYAFNVLDIYKIKAECYFDNVYMPNFLTKLGFKREGILQNETIVNDTPKNLEIWSIFNPKFEQKYPETLNKQTFKPNFHTNVVFLKERKSL